MPSCNLWCRTSEFERNLGLFEQTCSTRSHPDPYNDQYLLIWAATRVLGKGRLALALALPLRVYSPLPEGWRRPHRLGVWREGCETDRWRR